MFGKTETAPATEQKKLPKINLWSFGEMEKDYVDCFLENYWKTHMNFSE